MDLGAHKESSKTLSNISALSGVRALVLVGGRPGAERFGEFPLALLDVLGRSVLLRTIDRIHAAGISNVAVLSDTAPLPTSHGSASCPLTVVSPESFWDEALQQFRRLARQSECVLVVRLGAWVEVDFAAIVNQYRNSSLALMRACSLAGDELDVFVISSASYAEAAALLRGEIRDDRIEAAEYKTFGYINLLRESSDLRTLVLDSFAGESDIRPIGRELRPGIWLGRGAHVHPRARLVAPTFVGAYSRVRSAAVVTRGSALEHHSEIDCATIIENSNVLPFTRVGAGLDIERCVLGFGQIHSLRKNITIDVEDPHLIRATYMDFSARMFTVAGWLLALLPNVVSKLLLELSAEPQEAVTSEALISSTPTLQDASLAPIESESETYREMAARRYGNE